MKKFIVKIQWPQAVFGGEAEVLIYNKDRTVYELTPCTKELRKLTGGYKVYCNAFIDENKILQICEKVKWQDW